MADKRLIDNESSTTVDKFYGNKGDKDVQIPLADAASVLAEGNPHYINEMSNASVFMVDTYKRPNENFCALINLSTAEKFLSIIINGNDARGIFAKIIMDVNGASDVFKLKIKENDLYIRTYGGTTRLYGYKYSTPIKKTMESNTDLSDAQDVEYI